MGRALKVVHVVVNGWRAQVPQQFADLGEGQACGRERSTDPKRGVGLETEVRHHPASSLTSPERRSDTSMWLRARSGLVVCLVT